MIMHPDYPELVSTALASDQYWQVPEEELTAEIAESQTPANQLTLLGDRIRLMRNEEVASQIASVLHSLDEHATVEPIPEGEPLPTPHGRQVIRVIEDSREIIDKMSVLYLVDKFFKMKKAKINRQLEEENPGHRLSSFEENLEAIYANPLAGTLPAETRVSYGRFRVADLCREVLYMKRDTKTGLFLALPAGRVNLPHLWGGLLGIVPNEGVGNVYSKNMRHDTSYLGKIISAELIEADSVTWKKRDDSEGGDKDDKETETKDKTLPQITRGLPSTQ